MTNNSPWANMLNLLLLLPVLLCVLLFVLSLLLMMLMLLFLPCAVWAYRRIRYTCFNRPFGRPVFCQTPPL